MVHRMERCLRIFWLVENDLKSIVQNDSWMGCHLSVGQIFKTSTWRNNMLNWIMPLMVIRYSCEHFQNKKSERCRKVSKLDTFAFNPHNKLILKNHWNALKIIYLVEIMWNYFEIFFRHNITLQCVIFYHIIWKALYYSVIMRDFTRQTYWRWREKGLLNKI